MGLNDPLANHKTKQDKVLSRCLPRFVNLLYGTGCTLILVNQLRDKTGVLYGQPDHPTGGEALGYFSTLRLENRRIELIKSALGKVAGQIMAVSVQKYKYGPLDIRTAVKLVYGEGLRA